MAELVTDASNHAIGGILLQKENDQMKPVCYISRALTPPAELKYSITEKEVLALVWSIEKLHLYLYGKSFNVYVDHQPLKFIFASNSKLNVRISRWQLKLQAYDFKVIYKKGELNIADFVSKNCWDNAENDSDEKEILNFVSFVCNSVVPKSMTLEEIKFESSKDKVLIAVKNALISDRWYDNPLVKNFEKFRYELCDNDGIILKGNKIMLPYSLQRKALDIVHEGHLGIVKCKNLLRQKVYWSTLDRDVEDYVNKCISCQANVNIPKPERIRMSELPSCLWDEITIDFFGPLPSGESLLVTKDLYSRYPFIEIMKNTTANSVINRFEKLFSMFGYPNKVRSDNGPPFQSEILKTYFIDHGIQHIKITPRYPQANGTIERFMQIIGKTIKTAHFNNSDWRKELQSLLLNYRALIHSTTGRSPAQLLFNRDIRTKLPSIQKVTSPFDQEVREKQRTSYEKTKNRFDKKITTSKENIEVGDTVILKRHDRPGKFQSKFYSTMYEVISRKQALVIIRDNKGNTLARNISFLKKVNPNQENYKTVQRSTQPTRQVSWKTYPKRR